MSIETVVLCFPIEPAQIERVRANCGGRRVLVSNQDDIANDIFEADIFCGHAKKRPIAWDPVVQAGRLKWIQSSAAGLDHCLADVIVDSDILVSGCSALFCNQVAEHAAALLFGLVRNLPTFFRAQQKREFVRRPTDELGDKVIGIVGLGGNGQRIAQTLSPFVSKILAIDCFPNSCGKFADQVFPPEELNAVLADVDVLILTLPQTAENEKLIGKKKLGLMKEGSYLINMGRGSVVDHDALLDSLTSGHLAGAGLDVCDPEPLPRSSRLWELDNVLITPHVAAQSKTRVPMTVELFCANLGKYDRGEALLNLVDKRLGFPRPENRIGLNDPIFE